MCLGLLFDVGAAQDEDFGGDFVTLLGEDSAMSLVGDGLAISPARAIRALSLVFSSAADDVTRPPAGDATPADDVTSAGDVITSSSTTAGGGIEASAALRWTSRHFLNVVTTSCSATPGGKPTVEGRECSW